MTLRTPRRRISPRTKRRCRAIKDFLRRTLGSTSQPDLKISSSIAIDVSDLKHKIVGLEQQISEVNKHCQDLISLDSRSNILRGKHEKLTTLQEQTEVSSIGYSTETKLLYKSPDNRYRKSDDSSTPKVYNDSNYLLYDNKEVMNKPSRVRKKKIIDGRQEELDRSQSDEHKNKKYNKKDNYISSYTTSYHSIIDPRIKTRTVYPRRSYGNKNEGDAYAMPSSRVMYHAKDGKQKYCKKVVPERNINDYKIKNKSRTKRTGRDIDEDFISEIIRRQYKPTKLFGAKESGISQFSAPVCRDQEYPARENIQQGSDLCSCCFDGRRKCKYEHENDMSDMRSVCDTQLYSSKKHSRHKHHRRYDVKNHNKHYEDSDVYDLIPVKETRSPKMKRKVLAEEDILNSKYYKEVPPSPKTLRPQLNLKAQYFAEFEDYMMRKKNFEHFHSSKSENKYMPDGNSIQSYGSSTVLEQSKIKQNSEFINQNQKKICHDAGTMSIPTPILNKEQININNESCTFDKTLETSACTDKTDKALSEIKDLLQNFLQEIKKETSFCDNSEIMPKNGDHVINESQVESGKLNSSTFPNSNMNVTNYGLPQAAPAPIVPNFTNFTNHCYPVYPVYPMQNAYNVMPSPSFTCASCANNVKGDIFSKTTKDSPVDVKTGSETEELIKEIYNFVARKSTIRKNEDFTSPRLNDEKLLTSRSVGSSKLKQDAKVGTHKIKCYSKSCEAIGSRMTSDTYYSRTNPTYSDTVLERLSLEVTASESEISSESTTVKKEKPNKFTKVLRSFGLLKKKKEIIEELTESESTVEVDIKHKPPFQQEFADYMVNEQEYYTPPPMHNDFCHPAHNDCCHGLGPKYYPGHPGFPGYPGPAPAHQPIYGNFSHYKHTYEPGHALPPRPYPSAPPYPYPYEQPTQNQPQVPLCLKEVEVKTAATQFEKKTSFFGKFARKPQGPTVTFDDEPRNCSTQTAGILKQGAPFNPTKLTWKSLQAKINELDKPDNMNFSYKTQKKLGQGDMNMRNAMIKKLFYKKNPFSPGNIIVRTLLGKDKSSYGEPPAVYRPRMFF